jgi:hypothetical protein
VSPADLQPTPNAVSDARALDVLAKVHRRLLELAEEAEEARGQNIPRDIDPKGHKEAAPPNAAKQRGADLRSRDNEDPSD